MLWSKDRKFLVPGEPAEETDLGEERNHTLLPSTEAVFLGWSTQRRNMIDSKEEGFMGKSQLDLTRFWGSERRGWSNGVPMLTTMIFWEVALCTRDHEETHILTVSSILLCGAFLQRRTSHLKRTDKAKICTASPKSSSLVFSPLFLFCSPLTVQHGLKRFHGF